MNRRRATILLIAVTLHGCVSAPSPDVDQIFRGELEFTSLRSAIQQSPQISECPQPSIDRIRYMLKDFPDEEEVGKESFAIMGWQQGIAALSMTSSGRRLEDLFGPAGWPSSTGRLLSCGGLFTLASREQRTSGMLPLTSNPSGFQSSEVYDARLPNRRYEVTRITGYSGGLFPLRVGNELVFSYTALQQTQYGREGDVTSKLHGRMHYSVLGVNDAFSIQGVSIPGKVFLIARMQEKEGVETVRNRDYYYSQKLGWVVREVGYDAGSPVSVFDARSWSHLQ